jgi:hypothetical protein
MRERLAQGLMAIGIVLAMMGSTVFAQQRRAVTVRELFASNHRLEVEAGTEVLWADPHFDRVWFPRGGPQVKPTDAGLATRFDTPGTYKGTFTVSGGHSATDVYSLTVVVKGASR